MKTENKGVILEAGGATSPKDYLKLQILEKRERVINAFEEYDAIEAAGAGAPTHKVRSRFRSYLRQLSSYLKRYEKEKYDKWKEHSTTGTIEQVQNSYEELDDFLYEQGLLNFENLTKPTRPTAEGWNEARGMG